MIFKESTKLFGHLILESLNHRTTLSSVEKSQYENQVKGYDGERQFDRLLEEGKLTGLVINDLLLSTRDTYYQIDALLVTDEHIYLYEVKNYSGSYYYRDGAIYSESGHTIQDPVTQADRKRAYLHKLLLNLGYQIDISTHVVYIEPDFYIYSLPVSFPVISTYYQRRWPRRQTEIFALHDILYRPANLTNYLYDLLEKWILYPVCFSFDYKASRQTRTYSSCEHPEKYADAILMSIEELIILFPTTALTKRLACDCCGDDLENHM